MLGVYLFAAPCLKELCSKNQTKW